MTGNMTSLPVKYKFLDFRLINIRSSEVECTMKGATNELEINFQYLFRGIIIRESESIKVSYKFR